MTTINATLPIFHMPSMFTAALNGIRAQGCKPSVGAYISQSGFPTTGCVYRNPDGNKCAFGHCLPDSLYQESFEGMTAGPLLDTLLDTHTPRDLYGNQSEQDVRALASYMQSAHDRQLRRIDGTGPKEWEREMKRIATEFGFPELYTEPTIPQPATTEGATM